MPDTENAPAEESPLSRLADMLREDDDTNPEPDPTMPPPASDVLGPGGDPDGDRLVVSTIDRNSIFIEVIPAGQAYADDPYGPFTAQALRDAIDEQVGPDPRITMLQQALTPIKIGDPNWID